MDYTHVYDELWAANLTIIEQTWWIQSLVVVCCCWWRVIIPYHQPINENRVPAFDQHQQESFIYQHQPSSTTISYHQPCFAKSRILFTLAGASLCGPFWPGRRTVGDPVSLATQPVVSFGDDEHGWWLTMGGWRLMSVNGGYCWLMVVMDGWWWLLPTQVWVPWTHVDFARLASTRRCLLHGKIAWQFWTLDGSLSRIPSHGLPDI